MKSKIKVIDLFCGAGGTTEGIESAEIFNERIAEVVACVNHDAMAIKSHSANHPTCNHYTEDIRTLNVKKLPRKTDIPKATWVLWASLECTNFSKAKGGLPREADSRTLADHLHRYIRHINPDYIMIENVREFLSWGPLDENGKPKSRLNGKDFMKWRYTIEDMGYTYDHRFLNAADFGAYTSRTRYFGIFARKGFPIIFPEATHDKTERHNLKKWMPVKHVLDLQDEGKSIFERTKSLSEKTLERIYAGLEKFVANGDTEFIAKYFSGHPEGKVIATDAPAGAVKTKDSQSLVFITKYNSTNAKTGKYIPVDVNEPSPTVSVQNRLALTSPKFLAAYYSSGDNVSSVESPSPTISTKDRFQLVQPFIMRDFTNGGNLNSIENPSGALLPYPKMNLVTPFLNDFSFKNKGTSIEQPAPTLLASRRHYYLLNPQWQVNSGVSIEKPSFTLIARMDKTPPYLVTTESGELLIEFYDTDSTMLKKIKMFMAAYGIIDIKMRMLKVPELLKIQGFPANYILHGNQTDQKKFIGNAVVPIVPQRWFEALAERLNEYYKTKAA